MKVKIEIFDENENLLFYGSAILNAANSIKKGENTATVNSNENSSTFDINNLIKESGLTEKNLAEILHIDRNKKEFVIITEIPGNTDAEKQKNAVLILLTVRYYLTLKDTVYASEIKTDLGKLDILSLTNLATNLKSIRRFILIKGINGSHNTTYTITEPGRREGIKLIKLIFSKIEKMEAT